MGKIRSGLFITLDGVIEAPGKGDVTLRDKRGWADPYINDEAGISIFESLQKCDGLLLGKKRISSLACWMN